MLTISRREVVGAGAFTAGLASISSLLPTIAQGATVKRYDLTSSQGQNMLKIYAKAVGDMMALAQREPRGWLFQWYTHAVRDDRTKAGEISRVYGSGSSPDKQLASDTWNTCEAHFSNNEDYFLPWHRMFVLCLEQIVRNVSGEKDFTLPYWNYTDPSQRALPVEFRKQNDPVWGPLYRKDRNPGVNTGTPIDKVAGASPFDLNAMKSISYGASGGDAGFCANLDNDPHGMVHDDIGNAVGMGSIPWAANDPIFWMHHCNIDRIWASWNKAGGKNPNLTGTYTFAGGDGKKVQLDVAKFLDTIPLGYEYDKYLPRPAGSPPFPTASKAFAFAVRASSRATSGPISLGATPTTVTLAPAAPRPGAPAPANVTELSTSLKALPTESEFILTLENVHANMAPGVGYDVYVGLAEGQRPNRESPAYAGSLSFFGAVAHGMPGMAMPEIQRTYSFFVTRPVRQALGVAPNAVDNVTLVPTGTPRENSAPTIGAVALVSAT
jgi:tyrosinase